MSGPVEHAHAARAQALLDPVMGDDAPKPNVRFELAPLRPAHRWYIDRWLDGRDFIAQVPAARASRSSHPHAPPRVRFYTRSQGASKHAISQSTRSLAERQVVGQQGVQ